MSELVVLLVKSNELVTPLNISSCAAVLRCTTAMATLEGALARVVKALVLFMSWRCYWVMLRLV